MKKFMYILLFQVSAKSFLSATGWGGWPQAKYPVNYIVRSEHILSTFLVMILQFSDKYDF